MNRGVFVIIRKLIEEQHVYLCLNRRDPVLKYPAGVFELPGGGVDEGEDLKSAVTREVLEELGWDISEIQGQLSFFSDFAKPGSESSYYVLDLPTEWDLEITLSHEHVGFSWKTIQQIDGLKRYDMIALIRDMICLVDGDLTRTGVDGDFYFELADGAYRCRYGEKRISLSENREELPISLLNKV